MPPDTVEKPKLEEDSMYEQINEEEVREAIWNILSKKASGSDIIGFKALEILWEFIRKRFINLTRR